MYGVFYQIEALLSLKNAWLPPIFFLDTDSTYCTKFSFRIVLNHAKISVY